MIVKNQNQFYHYYYCYYYKNKYEINPIQIGKRQIRSIRLNHVFFDLNKLSKDTAFMFTLTPFSPVKLTASKNF